VCGNVKFGKEISIGSYHESKNVAQATQQGTGELKFGQAGINQIESLTKHLSIR
jgi:hypothetical protein